MDHPRLSHLFLSAWFMLIYFVGFSFSSAIGRFIVAPFFQEIVEKFFVEKHYHYYPWGEYCGHC